MEQWRTSILDDNGTLELTNISAPRETCPDHFQVYNRVWAATEILSVAVSFPAGMVILYAVAQRFLQSGQRGRSMSWSNLSTSSDLLLINIVLVGLFNAQAMLIHAFHILPGTLHISPEVITPLNHLVYTSGPCTVVSICMDCYLAVVHPVSYPHLKKTWRLPLLLTALTWTYGVTTGVIVIALRMPAYNIIWVVTYAVMSPTTLFLTISMLFALRLTGPKRRSLADLCSAKRQAFLMVLSITVTTVLYCLPQVALYICYHAAPEVHFRCAVFPLAMVIPTLMVAMIALLFAFRQAGVKFCMSAE